MLSYHTGNTEELSNPLGLVFTAIFKKSKEIIEKILKEYTTQLFAIMG